MAVTPATLQTRFPGTFGAVADAVLQPHITAAEAQVRAGIRCRDELVMNLAAHLALADSRAFVGSGISSASAGGVSVGFQSGGAGGGDEAGSGFLAEYKRLLHAVELPFLSMGGT